MCIFKIPHSFSSLLRSFVSFTISHIHLFIIASMCLKTFFFSAFSSDKANNLIYMWFSPHFDPIYFQSAFAWHREQSNVLARRRRKLLRRKNRSRYIRFLNLLSASTVNTPHCSSTEELPRLSWGKFNFIQQNVDIDCNDWRSSFDEQQQLTALNVPIDSDVDM